MKYSVIDISSSSISMIAADVTARSAEIVFKDRASLSLLHYLEGKSLSARGIDKLVEAVIVMKGKCAELGVDVLYLIATAALRAAENFDQVRAELLERTGLPVNLIDGRTEAYCDYVANRIYSSYEKAALIDIGGASTEICDLSVDDRNKMISLDVGIINLHKKFVEEIQPNEDEAKGIKKFVLRKLEKSELPGDAAFNTVVLVGATNLALYDVYAEYTGDAPEDGARTMSYKKFKKLTKHLLSGSSRSKLILETAPEKLHSVGIAAVVAKTLIKRFGAENIVASDRGVKEGYLELALAGKLEGAFYDFSKGGSFETVVKSTAPAAPAKRGRKPAAKEEGAAPAAPAKRGRKPAAKKEGAAPAKRGRKPAAKKEGAAPAAPAKRGRKPAAKEEETVPAAPAKRGRKPAAKEAEQTEQ